MLAHNLKYQHIIMRTIDISYPQTHMQYIIEKSATQNHIIYIKHQPQQLTTHNLKHHQQTTSNISKA